jgi:preprotein translocase subunit SecF
MQLFRNTNFDFLRWRWHAVALSTVVVLAGVAVIFTKGMPLGIEFEGGTSVVAEFDSTPSVESVRNALVANYSQGGQDAIVQEYGAAAQRRVLIRVPQVGEGGGDALGRTRAAVESALKAGNVGNFRVVATEIVSPSVGRELMEKGLWAFVLSLAGILAYIAFRFQLSFAVGAVVATLHDVLVALAFLAFFQYDMTLNVIAALLTVTGYSTNDTIVIFDRVRENQRTHRRDSLYNVINIALNQTLARTVITAGTALLSAIALFLFGGEVLEGFAFTMIVGIITGTYSSVFVAAAIATFWRRKQLHAEKTVAAGAPGAPTRGSKQRKARAS